MLRIVLQDLRLVVCAMLAVVEVGCGSARARPEASTPTRKSAAAIPSATSTSVYIVRAGDTLGRIARCSDTSVDRLAKSNEISDPDVLQVGSRLRLPSGHRCVAASTRSAGNPAKRQKSPEDAATARAEGFLRDATKRLDAADFEKSIELTDRCVQELLPYTDDGKASRLRARCHVAGGMAAAGLDRKARAIEEFRQAFALDPSLEFAPETTSPRVLDLVSAARSSP